MKSRHTFRVIVAVILFTPFLFLALSLPPQEVQALRLFTPFGGRIISLLPAAGCIPIRAAVLAATAGTVDISVDELLIGPPLGTALGVLKISGVPTMPLPTNIYESSLFTMPSTPGTWVLGNSLKICDVCGKLKGVPIVDDICNSIPGIGDILGEVCDLVGTACPITNLIYNIGSSGR